MHAWLAQRSAAVEAQRVLQAAKQLDLIAAESALRAVELELDFLAEAREVVAGAQVCVCVCVCARVGVENQYRS